MGFTVDRLVTLFVRGVTRGVIITTVGASSLVGELLGGSLSLSVGSVGSLGDFVREKLVR